MELDTKSKVSYGLGGFGKNVAYTFVASYTLYYYNTVLSISAAFTSTKWKSNLARKSPTSLVI